MSRCSWFPYRPIRTTVLLCKYTKRRLKQQSSLSLQNRSCFPDRFSRISCQDRQFYLQSDRFWPKICQKRDGSGPYLGLLKTLAFSSACRGLGRQTFALRAHPSQPCGWAPPSNVSEGGHGSSLPGHCHATQRRRMEETSRMRKTRNSYFRGTVLKR